MNAAVPREGEVPRSFRRESRLFLWVALLLILFLNLLTLLFLRAAVEDPERRPRIAAAYALFAGVLMPFLTIVAPRVTASLHPQTVINPQGKILMDTPTKVVFFNGLAAFSGLFFWMLSIAARAERLSRRGTASP